MKYYEIRKQAEEKRSLLFKEVGLFFAFSNEQFHENKTPLVKGDKYVSIGAGGFLPKSKIDAFIKGNKDITRWEKEEIKKDKALKYEHIRYELANHECYYTMDITSALEVLPYSKKDVMKVFRETLEKEKQY